MTEQLLVSFVSPSVTAGGGPILSVIGGYLAVFMLQGATWTQRLTFKPHIGTFFTLSRCPRFTCRHCPGVRRDSGTYRTSNWIDCGLQRVHFSKAMDTVRESSVCMSQSFLMVVFQICSLTKIHQTVYEQKGLHKALKAHHRGDSCILERTELMKITPGTYSCSILTPPLPCFQLSLSFFSSSWLLCSASYFTDVSVADSG